MDRLLQSQLKPRLLQLATVAEVTEQISAYRPSRAIRRQTEAVQEWRRFYEAFLHLLSQTVEDGWPFQQYRPGWAEGVLSEVVSFEQALSVEPDCHFPQRSTSNLRRLASALQRAANDPRSLSGREVGWARRILLDSEARWGALGSEERQRALARQCEGDPSVLEVAREALLERLRRLPPEGGVSDLERLLAPTGDGTPIPEPLARRARRAWRATPRQLIEAGLLDTPLALAKVAADWGEQAEDADTARTILVAMVELAWSQFPEAELPEELIATWQRLATVAGLAWRPLKDGVLHATPDHLLAAQATAVAARGTVYARYYALTLEQLGDVTLTPEALWALCCRRLAERSASVPPPGQISEELRLLTSDGCWPLWAELGPRLHPLSSAARCWEAIEAEQRRPAPRKYQGWRRHRRIAHLWQRLLFFLSLLEPSELARFVEARADERSEVAPRPALLLRSLLTDVPNEPSPPLLTGWSS